MKFFAILLLSCVCMCYSVTVTTWGNVHAKTMGAQKVIVTSSVLGTTRQTFTYPNVSMVSLQALVLL